MLRKCIQAGVRITVEDLDEPERINQIAGSLNKVAKIRFRVKPNFSNLWKKTDFALESFSIDVGIQVYKSGIPAQYLVDLGKQVLAMKNVELTGLHFHGGRHHASLWYWRGMMKRFAKLVLHLCDAWGGYRPQELDIGGGFAIRRDPHSKNGLRADTLLTFFSYPLELAMYALTAGGRYQVLSQMLQKIMVKVPPKKRAPSIEEYAEVSVSTFRDTLQKGGLDLTGIKLQVEHVADIVGHSCYADRILPLVKVPDMKEGDLIAMLDMGAYQEVSAANFNALPRPAVVMVKDDQAEIIKTAETIEDVYRRDRIPAHLKTKQTQNKAGVSHEKS